MDVRIEMVEELYEIGRRKLVVGLLTNGLAWGGVILGWKNFNEEPKECGEYLEKMSVISGGTAHEIEEVEYGAGPENSWKFKISSDNDINRDNVWMRDHDGIIMSSDYLIDDPVVEYSDESTNIYVGEQEIDELLEDSCETNFGAQT